MVNSPVDQQHGSSLRVPQQRKWPVRMRIGTRICHGRSGAGQMMAEEQLAFVLNQMLHFPPCGISVIIHSCTGCFECLLFRILPSTKMRSLCNRRKAVNLDQGWIPILRFANPPSANSSVMLIDRLSGTGIGWRSGSWTASQWCMRLVMRDCLQRGLS